jgi:hypothetical protein
MAHTLLLSPVCHFHSEMLGENGERRMKYRSFVTLFSAAVLAVGTIVPTYAQSYHPEYANGERDLNRSDEGAGYDRDAQQRWHRFLEDENNQNFARQYRGNPNIIHDSREMEQWSGVRELFNNHPDVREYVEQKVRDYNENTRPADKWNREMAANPNFAERYRDNPNIINDGNLRNDEPEIAEFLRTNPDVQTYLNSYASRSDRGDRDEDFRGDSSMSNFMNNHPNIRRQLRDNPSLINDPDFVRRHPGLHEYLQNHPDARF